MRLRPQSRPVDEERAAARTAEWAGELERRLGVLTEVLDALPVGVVVCDEGGSDVLRNRQASAPVGEVQVDVLVVKALDALMTNARHSDARQHESLELRGPPVRSFELTAEPLASGGVLGVVEDASERRRLDTVRRDFVANVNHELRTPIGALGVLAEALAGETEPDVVHRLVTRMSVEVERARALIEDVLDLSRIEAVTRRDPQSVAVADVVEAAVQRVQALAERSRVKVVVGAVAPAVIEGDRAELVSALSNLLDNAVKYSEEGSEVEVSAARVPAGAGPAGAGPGGVEIVVRDTGIGIPAKDLDRVFERFYRVDRARDRRTGGSGLGLAIVRHVAANHHGEVAVESVEGQGSRFTLRLPAEEGP
ncbi:MAG TPA: ATP-binding protein [Acidimicrobiales bacterium]|nr:ATP-binding protein [Acidimicrobiales bacterium]